MKLLPYLSALLFVTLLSTSLPARAAAEEPPDISGTWAQKMVTTSSYRLARIARFTQVSTSILRVDVRQNGERLDVTTRFCSIDMENTAPGAAPRLSDGFLSSLEPTRRPGHLRKNGASWVFHLPKTWNVHGVRLDDPDRDRLPEDADDPRVFDQDNNGHPGFTLHIDGAMGGEMHLAQRIWDRFTGPLNGDAHSIEGSVEWGSEQTVLEASRRHLRSTPVNEPDLRESYFQMVRLEDRLSCQEILRRVPALFD